MKYINYVFLLGAIVLTGFGIFYWLAEGRIEYAAFFLALAAMGHSTYLHATKADKTAVK
jgi:hypothetical protein